MKLSWYNQHSSVRGASDDLLGTVEQYLPPMTPNAVTVGFDGREAWTPDWRADRRVDASGRISFSFSLPLLDATVWEAGEFVIAEVDVRAKLVTEGFGSAAHAVFSDLAEQWGSIVGVGEIISGYEWKRGTLWSDANTEPFRNLVQVRQGTLLGLPPSPTSWLWLGNAFPRAALSARGLLLAEQRTSGTLLSEGPTMLSRTAVGKLADVVKPEWRAAWGARLGRSWGLEAAARRPG